MTLTRLAADEMRAALRGLDQLLKSKVTLVMGGGGAMILAHGYPLATTDIDAIPKGIELGELDLLVKQVAAAQDIPTDWLNPYFATYSHTLPHDYSARLIEVFSGQNLSVLALGKDEMLIMKCFAHRQKDVSHAKALVLGGAEIARVQARIEELEQKKIPGAAKALEFLEDILEQVDQHLEAREKRK